MSVEQAAALLSGAEVNGLALLSLIEEASPDERAEIARVLQDVLNTSEGITWIDAPYSLAADPERWRAAGFDDERRDLIDRAFYTYIRDHWIEFDANRSHDTWLIDDGGALFTRDFRGFLTRWEQLWSAGTPQREWQQFYDDVVNWLSPYVKVIHSSGKRLFEILVGMQLVGTDRFVLLRHWEDETLHRVFPGAPVFSPAKLLEKAKEFREDNPEVSNDELYRVFLEWKQPYLEAIDHAWQIHMDDMLMTLVLSQLLEVPLTPVSWRLGLAASNASADAAQEKKSTGASPVDLQRLHDRILTALEEDPSEAGFNKAFGDLRSFLSQGDTSRKWRYWANKLFRTAVDVNERAYRAIWLDYISSFKHLWNTLFHIHPPFTLVCLAELELAVRAAPFALYCLELTGQSERSIEPRDHATQVREFLGSGLLRHVAHLTILNHDLDDEEVAQLFATEDASNLRVVYLGERYPMGHRTDSEQPAPIRHEHVRLICGSDHLGDLRILMAPFDEAGAKLLANSEKLHRELREHYANPISFSRRRERIHEELNIPPMFQERSHS